MLGNSRPHKVGARMRDLVRHDEIMPDAPEGAADLRGAGRIALLIRSAKLIAPEGEFLCVVRDASEGGVSVRLFHPLPHGEPLMLEMPNGDRHTLERVWEEKGRAGFRFTGPVDITRIVEGPSLFARRAMRVNHRGSAASSSWPAAACRRRSATSRSTARRSPPRSGCRWFSGSRSSPPACPRSPPRSAGGAQDSYGLSFEDTFQFAELAAGAPRAAVRCWGEKGSRARRALTCP